MWRLCVRKKLVRRKIYDWHIAANFPCVPAVSHEAAKLKIRRLLYKGLTSRDLKFLADCAAYVHEAKQYSEEERKQWREFR